MVDLLSQRVPQGVHNPHASVRGIIRHEHGGGELDHFLGEGVVLLAAKQHDRTAGAARQQHVRRLRVALQRQWINLDLCMDVHGTCNKMVPYRLHCSLVVRSLSASKQCGRGLPGRLCRAATAQRYRAIRRMGDGGLW